MKDPFYILTDHIDAVVHTSAMQAPCLRSPDYPSFPFEMKYVFSLHETSTNQYIVPNLVTLWLSCGQRYVSRPYLEPHDETLSFHIGKAEIDIARVALLMHVLWPIEHHALQLAHYALT